MQYLKSLLKYAEKVFLPLLATIIVIDFWETVNKGIIILLFLYLLLSVLEKLDIKFKPLQKLKRTKIGKIFVRLIRSSNPVTQYSQEQLDETSEMIAIGLIEGKKQVKKIKEEIKLKKRYERIKLLIKHNKSVVTGYVLALLYILEVKFEWATNLGIPNEWLPYIAVLIVAFIFYVMFGEGFTFNDINEIREEAIAAKKTALIAIGKTQSEYDKNDDRVKELKDMFKDSIPEEYADEWNMLHLKMDKLTLALESLNQDLEEAKKLIKSGKE